MLSVARDVCDNVDVSDEVDEVVEALVSVELRLASSTLSYIDLGCSNLKLLLRVFTGNGGFSSEGSKK
jgi:hypothetical protein